MVGIIKMKLSYDKDNKVYYIKNKQDIVYYIYKRILFEYDNLEYLMVKTKYDDSIQIMEVKEFLYSCLKSSVCGKENEAYTYYILFDDNNSSLHNIRTISFIEVDLINISIIKLNYNIEYIDYENNHDIEGYVNYVGHYMYKKYGLYPCVETIDLCARILDEESIRDLSKEILFDYIKGNSLFDILTRVPTDMTNRLSDKLVDTLNVKKLYFYVGQIIKTVDKGNDNDLSTFNYKFALGLCQLILEIRPYKKEGTANDNTCNDI